MERCKKRNLYVNKGFDDLPELCFVQTGVFPSATFTNYCDCVVIGCFANSQKNNSLLLAVLLNKSLNWVVQVQTC